MFVDGDGKEYQKIYTRFLLCEKSVRIKWLSCVIQVHLMNTVKLCTWLQDNEN